MIFTGPTRRMGISALYSRVCQRILFEFSSFNGYVYKIIVYFRALYFTGKTSMPATKDIHTQVILVNEQDIEIGQAEKLAAHQQGLLHRAFSVFIFRRLKAKQPELLLQQR